MENAPIYADEDLPFGRVTPERHVRSSTLVLCFSGQLGERKVVLDFVANPLLTGDPGERLRELAQLPGREARNQSRRRRASSPPADLDRQAGAPSSTTIDPHRSVTVDMRAARPDSSRSLIIRRVGIVDNNGPMPGCPNLLEVGNQDTWLSTRPESRLERRQAPKGDELFEQGSSRLIRAHRPRTVLRRERRWNRRTKQDARDADQHDAPRPSIPLATGVEVEGS